MSDVSVIAFSVFIFFFLLVTVLGFAAARWRRAQALDNLDEWGLGGRGFGTFIAWFLIGGDLYTAYTFIAVPALLYAGSAIGFFAVPYTIVVYPLIFLFLPRLWSVSHRHGYVTPADFVEGRYDSRPLALAVALTGILATMPYIALQLVGIEVVLEVMGIGVEEGSWFVGHAPLFIAFGVLAAYTYSSGLRAPALIAFVKDTLIYIVIFIAIIYLPTQLGGWDSIFSAASDNFDTFNAENADAIAAGEASPEEHDPRAAAALGLRLARAGVGAGAVHVPALGDRGAVDPAAVGDPAQRGAAPGVLLPAGAARPARLRRHRGGRAGHQPAAGGAAAVRERVPRLVRRASPSRRSSIGALVPAAIMSIAAANLWTRNIYKAYLNRDATPAQEAKQSKVASLLVKFGALAFVLFVSTTYALDLQLLGGVWMLQTFPAIVIGLYTGWCHRHALLAGWAVGMAYGTWVAYANPKVGDPGSHFGSPLNEFPFTDTLVYIGFTAFLINMIIVVVGTAVLQRAERARGRRPDVTGGLPRGRGRPGSGGGARPERPGPPVSQSAIARLTQTDVTRMPTFS